MKKPQAVSKEQTSRSSPRTCDFISRYPSIWEFLSAGAWDDGSPRVPGTLLLCVDDSRVKVWVNDKGLGLTAWLSAETPTGLLEGLEAALRDDAVDWRQVKPQAGSRRGKSG